MLLTREQEFTVLIAEDDDGHAELVRQHLEESGVVSPILRFRDGQEALDFFFGNKTGGRVEPGRAYVLLLDVRMPRVDGIAVLRRLKAADETRCVPVIMLTTTDDPQEINLCYALGCNVYVTKPLSFEGFGETLQRLGFFLRILRVAPVQ